MTEGENHNNLNYLLSPAESGNGSFWRKYLNFEEEMLRSEQGVSRERVLSRDYQNIVSSLLCLGVNISRALFDYEKTIDP